MCSVRADKEDLFSTGTLRRNETTYAGGEAPSDLICKCIKNPPTQRQQHHRLFIDCPHVADDDAFNTKCTIENLLRYSVSSSFRHNILSRNGDPDDRLQVNEDNITELADLGGRSASSAGVPSDSVTNNLILSALTSNQATGLQLDGLE